MTRRIVIGAAEAVVAIVVVAFFVLMFASPETIHFDGQLGDGCDAGNKLCTYKEWVKTCEGGATKCSIEVYHRKGGR